MYSFWNLLRVAVLHGRHLKIIRTDLKGGESSPRFLKENGAKNYTTPQSFTHSRGCVKSKPSLFFSSVQVQAVLGLFWLLPACHSYNHEKCLWCFSQQWGRAPTTVTPTLAAFPLNSSPCPTLRQWKDNNNRKLSLELHKQNSYFHLLPYLKHGTSESWRTQITHRPAIEARFSPVTGATDCNCCCLFRPSPRGVSTSHYNVTAKEVPWWSAKKQKSKWQDRSDIVYIT